MFNKILILVFALAVITIIFMDVNVAKAQSFVTKGLVSYWPFDSRYITGKNVKDWMGNNDGTIKGNPKIVEGKVGQALQFDGEDDYVDTNEQDDFKFGTGDFTVSFWMKANVWDGYTALLSNSVYAGGWDGFHFEHEDWDGSPGEINSIRFHILNDWINSDITLSTNRWYHIVGVRSSGTAYIYIDKVNRGNTVATGNVDVDRNLLIGKNPDETYPRNFNGLIDEVRIYYRALSEAEISQNYNSIGAVVNPGGKLSLTWGEIKASR